MVNYPDPVILFVWFNYR